MGDMREQIWNRRTASTQHYRWYRNLADLHGVTASWLRDLGVERPSYFLSRGVSSINSLGGALGASGKGAAALSEDLSSALWMLEQSSLDSILDDSKPEELLARLEITIWSVQCWTASALIEQAPDREKASTMNRLEQSAWQAGRACADRRWGSLAAEARERAPALLGALRDSPLSGNPGRENFLLQRLTEREARVELRICPHVPPFTSSLGTSDQCDRLCRLHAHFTQGFLYSLNTKAIFEQSSPEGRRCEQRWQLPA